MNGRDGRNGSYEERTPMNICKRYHPSLLVVGWTVGTFCLLTNTWQFQLWGGCLIMSSLALFLWFPSRS